MIYLAPSVESQRAVEHIFVRFGESEHRQCVEKRQQQLEIERTMHTKSHEHTHTSSKFNSMINLTTIPSDSCLHFPFFFLLFFVPKEKIGKARDRKQTIKETKSSI